MMMNRGKNIALLICVMSVLVLSGCTKSNIMQSQGPAQPEFETKEGIALDWTQIGSDMDEQFVDNVDYPMATSVNYKVDQDKKTIQLTLMVKDGTTSEDAVKFANAAVRYLNDEAAMQDFSFEKSSDTSYGGFFKEYDLNLMVMPEYAQPDKDKWLVDMNIPKGSDKKIVPANKTNKETESQAEKTTEGTETTQAETTVKE